MNRIDGSLNPLITSRTLGGSPAAATEGADSDRSREAEAVGGKQDAVLLSFRSRSMAEVSQAVAAAPEVRADRVSTIRSQIANGTYTSNAREIAQRLLSSGTFGE